MSTEPQKSEKYIPKYPKEIAEEVQGIFDEHVVSFKSESSELKDLFLIVDNVGRIKSGRITVTNTEYEIINAYVEKSVRQREAEAYKKGLAENSTVMGQVYDVLNNCNRILTEHNRKLKGE